MIWRDEVVFREKVPFLFGLFFVFFLNATLRNDFSFSVLFCVNMSALLGKWCVNTYFGHCKRFLFSTFNCDQLNGETLVCGLKYFLSLKKSPVIVEDH